MPLCAAASLVSDHASSASPSIDTLDVIDVSRVDANDDGGDDNHHELFEHRRHHALSTKLSDVVAFVEKHDDVS